MNLVHPKVEDFYHMSYRSACALIVRCARKCYQSESTDLREEDFIRKRIKEGHHSILEHVSITVNFIIDRGISHELVRHRLGAYSQESTRYCNYGKKGVTYVIPSWINLPEGQCTVYTGNLLKYSDDKIVEVNSTTYHWLLALQQAEEHYNSLITSGWTPQKARSVLPNSLKTEIAATYNIRQWRHVLQQRTSPKCHPDMITIMLKVLYKLSENYPVFFEGLGCQNI